MKKLSRVLAWTLALILIPGSAGLGEDAETSILDMFAADREEYAKRLQAFQEYDPAILPADRLAEGSLTGPARDAQPAEGGQLFVRNGDTLTAVIAGDPDGIALVSDLLRSAGRDDINSELLGGYIEGLAALGQENPYLTAETDGDSGEVRLSVNIDGLFQMKGLDEMVVNETVLSSFGVQALGEEAVSTSFKCGKIGMKVSGTAEDATIVLGEYSGLDDLGYQSLINTVKVLKPDSWEDFVSQYAELKDAETPAYSAAVNVDDAAVRENGGEPFEDYSYVVIRFGR